MLPGIDLDDPVVQQGMRDFAVPTRLFNEVRKTGQRAGLAAAFVRVPTLIVQGDKDPVVSASQTRQLLGNFTYPVTYVQLSAQHDLLDANQPAWPQTMREIQQFLSGFTCQEGAE